MLRIKDTAFKNFYFKILINIFLKKSNQLLTQ